MNDRENLITTKSRSFQGNIDSEMFSSPKEKIYQGTVDDTPIAYLGKEDILDKFINDNNMNLHKIKSNDLYTIQKAEDINPLLAAFSVFTDTQRKSICIKDIVGYDYKNNGFGSNDFITNMKAFYSDSDNTYMNRCNDLLKYNSDELINVLYPSFKDEPITVKEVEDKFVINYNGIHRYNLLKLHYLNEISNSNNIESVNEKYTIPVEVSKVDKDLSYCNALLNLSNPDNYCKIDYTNEDCIEVSINSNKSIMNRNDLYKYVFSNCINDNTRKVIEKYNYIDSFNEFITKSTVLSDNKML